MTEELKNEILTSYRRGASFDIMADLYPMVDTKELNIVLHEAGYTDEEGKTYNKRIKEKRISLNLSQKQFAEVLELNHSTIARLESSGYRSTLLRMAYETLINIEKNGILKREISNASHNEVPADSPKPMPQAIKSLVNDKLIELKSEKESLEEMVRVIQEQIDELEGFMGEEE